MWCTCAGGVRGRGIYLGDQSPSETSRKFSPVGLEPETGWFWPLPANQRTCTSSLQSIFPFLQAQARACKFFVDTRCRCVGTRCPAPSHSHPPTSGSLRLQTTSSRPHRHVTPNLPSRRYITKAELLSASLSISASLSFGCGRRRYKTAASTGVEKLGRRRCCR